MSLNDDTCDFCGNEFDAMGNDLWRAVLINGERLCWCGCCSEGADAQWGGWSVQQIEAYAATVQAKYDADPIDWNAPAKEWGPEDYQRRAGQLWLQDTAHHLERYLKHRKEQQR